MPSAHNSSPPYNDLVPGYFDLPATVDNPVPVAEQRAAGVPAEATVTMSDQRSGVQLDDSFSPPEDGDEVEGDDELSAGTSSSASDKKQDKSGSSGTPGPQSLVQGVGSLSAQGQVAKAAPSSSVSSTDGSTQETGPSHQGQPDSSETATPATPEQGQDPEQAHVLLVQARNKFDAGDFDGAEELVDQAALLAPEFSEVGEARKAIDAAKAAQHSN